ncbi:MAG: hypothetical protein M9933_00090 [Chitinophagaceae bacterium]|nr:hypothetical protein [Chitinophagaceae bacterium]
MKAYKDGTADGRAIFSPGASCHLKNMTKIILPGCRDQSFMLFQMETLAKKKETA